MSYGVKKSIARQAAIDWQYESNYDISMGELLRVISHFYKLGKRYGLLREFRENGIPC